MAAPDEPRPPIRWGFLYAIAVSVLLEIGMARFFIGHSGRFTRVEDYIQFGLVTLFAIAIGAVGIRYTVLILQDLKGR